MTRAPAGRPFLVEIVGLPGSGKSTAVGALRARHPAIAPMPILRSGPHRALLARHLARTLATLAGRRALGRHWTRDGVVMMAYLTALPEALTGPGRPDAPVIVFDQGPLYTLSRPSLRHERLRGWRDRAIERWRGLLDLVVWLDADDDILLARIDEREKVHRLKNAGDAPGRSALAADRAVLEDLLGHLGGGISRPRLVRIDTGAKAPEEIASELLAMIGER